MILWDHYYHILKMSGQYIYFWSGYKDVIKLGDYGNVKYLLCEGRLGQVGLGFLNHIKGPLRSYPESFRSISLVLVKL